MSDVILDVVNRRGDFEISDAIIGGELDRTIDGASTLTIQVHDPHCELIRSKGMQRAVDLQYDGTWFRLVKINKSGVTVTLTFEDRDVAYLRRHTKPRKVSRGKSTRAQFVRTLVREVTQKRIKFFCPEVNEKQPIGKPKEKSKTTKRTKRTRTENKEKGIPDDAQVSVKGVGATKTQRKNGERVLDVADQLGAGPKAMKALMEAVIVESEVQNLTHGHSTSIGILQLLDIHGSVERRLDIEWCVTKFLRDGFTGKGGAMELARKNPGWTAGNVAQGVQGSGFPERYDIFSDEADDWIDAYGGPSGADSGGSETTTTTTRRKRYEFSRGEPGKREDSWTCIQRLASEVNWRAFMDRGTLYFVSEDRLISAKATYIVSEDTAGVSWIDFDFDSGKKTSEATVTARTDLFDVRIGSVMAIRDMGVANGRYLVAGVRRGLFDTDTTIDLKRATPKLDEPAPETATTTRTTTREAVDLKGTLREKIVAVAEASRKNYNANKQAWDYSMTGASYYQDPTKPPKPGTRTDCSHWVCCVFKKAGAPPPGSAEIGATGSMWSGGKEVPLKDALPGDVILYGRAPSHHVELMVTGGKTIGHGTKAVDYGVPSMMADPHCYRYDFLDVGDEGKSAEELSSKYGWGY